MSQAGIISFGADPEVATSYVTNSGTAVPVANVLNIFASDSNVNTVAGITSGGSGNTVGLLLTNRIRGVVTTVGAFTSDIITFSLGTIPGTYIFQFTISGFESTTPSGLGYVVTSTARTTGAAATIIGVPFEDINEDAALAACDFNINAVGNNIVLSVTGSAGLTIDWSSTGLYTFV